MQIVFVTPHIKISGGTRILLTYAHLLARRGHDVRVLVEETSRMRRYIGVCVGKRPLRWIAPDFKPRIQYVPRISTEECGGADAVIVSTSRHALALSSHKALVHLIQHDDGLYHEPREVADRAYMLSCPKITVSSWVKEVVRSRNKNATTAVLLNPIDRTLFSLVEGLRPKTPPVRILLLDHPYVWKGTKEGVRIVEKLRAEGANIELVSFSAENTTASFACDEFHANIPQPQLRELYSSIHIYLCPSWDEGSGLPSMEAMACGAALVTYDNGGSRDYANSNTAFVAIRKDEGDLLEKCREAITHTAKRERIALAGKSYIEHMPTWETQTDEFERVLTHIHL